MSTDDDRTPATALLLAWNAGDRSALDRLMPMVHDELRRTARRLMARERPEHTLQPTALVNEAFLRPRNRVGKPQGWVLGAECWVLIHAQ